MKYTYNTKNTCSKIIEFDMDDKEIVTNVKFLGGGCQGNLQAVPKLVEGMSASEIENKLGGIICGMRGTSCANELVCAIKQAKESINKE